MHPREAYERRESVVFLDVRTDYEFTAGHVEGSRHIPLNELPARLQELDAEQPIVVTCQVGQRSDLAAQFLRANGFDAENLEGGLEWWKQEGLPLVTDRRAGTVVDGWAQELEQ